MSGAATWRTIAAAALLAAFAGLVLLPGRSAAPATQHCPVTHANGSAPPGEAHGGDHHGNGKLWTSLNRDGTFTVAPESSPEYLDEEGAIAVDGVLGDDGSIGIKAPWWRGPGVRGLVRIEAERLDRDAPTVTRTIPESGYGLTGFQATGLALPSTGCWRVTGSVGSARLTFVTLIAEAR
jgi:hypothetical protein